VLLIEGSAGQDSTRSVQCEAVGLSWAWMWAACALAQHRISCLRNRAGDIVGLTSRVGRVRALSPSRRQTSYQSLRLTKPTQAIGAICALCRAAHRGRQRHWSSTSSERGSVCSTTDRQSRVFGEGVEGAVLGRLTAIVLKEHPLGNTSHLPSPSGQLVGHPHKFDRQPVHNLCFAPYTARIVVGLFS